MTFIILYAARRPKCISFLTYADKEHQRSAPELVNELTNSASLCCEYSKYQTLKLSSPHPRLALVGTLEPGLLSSTPSLLRHCIVFILLFFYSSKSHPDQSTYLRSPASSLSLFLGRRKIVLLPVPTHSLNQ